MLHLVPVVTFFSTLLKMVTVAVSETSDNQIKTPRQNIPSKIRLLMNIAGYENFKSTIILIISNVYIINYLYIGVSARLIY